VRFLAAPSPPFPSGPRTHVQTRMQPRCRGSRASASTSAGISIALSVSIVVRVLRSQQAAGTVCISRRQRGEQFVSGHASAAAEPGRQLSGSVGISAAAGACLLTCTQLLATGSLLPDVVSANINLLTMQNALQERPAASLPALVASQLTGVKRVTISAPGVLLEERDSWQLQV